MGKERYLPNPKVNATQNISDTYTLLRTYRMSGHCGKRHIQQHQGKP